MTQQQQARHSSSSDWGIILRALVESGEHLRITQTIRKDQNREIRLAQAEERRERDAARTGGVTWGTN